MTNPMSTAMNISNDETTYVTCPSSGSTVVQMPKLPRVNNVRDLKRSRFDEIENYRQNQSSMALRVCKVQKRDKGTSEPLEIELLRDILHDHPRIVRLHEAIPHPHTMQLYFDYYPGGDLFGVMAHYVQEWQAVPESFIWHCFIQLAEALAFIHHGYDRRQTGGPPPSSEWQSIIHGDIKPENIFLGPPTADSHGYPSLVLGDFGLATIEEYPIAGTWKWQPPELPVTSKKADVWALGAVIHALAHDGRAPLRPRPEGMDPLDFYRWPAAREPMPLLGAYTTELHNIVIHGALQMDPRARYSSLEVLQCVAVEVELGVASHMCKDPLIGPDCSGKTYDENGVTENNSDAILEDNFQEGEDSMDLCEVEPMACCCDPVQDVSCY